MGALACTAGVSEMLSFTAARPHYDHIFVPAFVLSKMHAEIRRAHNVKNLVLFAATDSEQERLKIQDAASASFRDISTPLH